jgi:hypothetical protein
MTKFLGAWLLVSLIDFLNIAFWLSLLINRGAAKTYRTALVIACALHPLTTAPIAALVASLN